MCIDMIKTIITYYTFVASNLSICFYHKNNYNTLFFV
ncbi:rCG25516 [Rattus norvegicus]|uniref:RCG25516 n=1 Tax=Rattus norvegicus TaxID=10116 RepID=A6I269_RAT|nr:rCG25516 [Rattus norvegicus]